MKNNNNCSNPKLFNKLKSLIDEQAVVQFNNGVQFKRCGFGNSDSKTFIVNKIKYKLEFEVEQQCNNMTSFNPTFKHVKVVDWRKGLSYNGIERIAEFFGLLEAEVSELFEPMILKTHYTEDDVKQTVLDHKRYLKGFREQFCLNS